MAKSLRLRCDHATDHVVAAASAQRFAREVGFADRSASAIAIAVGELVSNAVRHAGEGVLELRTLDGVPPGIEIRVRDQGPGIEKATLSGPHDHHGLAAVMRLVDHIEISSGPDGTTVIACCYLATAR